MDKAFDWYCEEMKSTEDHARYLYNLVSAPEPPKKPKGRGRAMSEDEDEKAKRTMQPVPLK